MTEFEMKVIENFPGKVVRKDLTSLMKKGANVPTYVLEYLLGMYCATDDEEAIEVGMNKIRRILSENYVRPDQSEYVKSKIKENGQYTIIDKITVVFDEREDKYVARFTNLRMDPFEVSSDLVVHNEKLLIGGIWCIMKINYVGLDNQDNDDGEDFEVDIYGNQKKKKKIKKKKSKYDSPFEIASLKPIQMPNLDLDEIKEVRQNFSKDEWIALLLRSAGYEPDELNQKEKLHYLLRFVPFIQKNYNLVELGPRGTGKSHAYSELSPYSILMSSGTTTVSNMFYNMSSRRVGLVGNWDCIAFDEVAGITQASGDMVAKRSYTIGEMPLNRILDITDIRRKDPNFANAREIRNILDQVIMCQNLRCMGTGETEIGLVDVNKYIHDSKINLPAASGASARSIASGEEELDRLVGLETVKRMVKKIKAYAKRNKGLEDFNLHMCFYGNPGTGKTEVARILSRILHDASVLDEAKLVETDALGLLGKFVGETAPKTTQKINEAMGGVLFIDEAYALTNGTQQSGGSTSYGEEAIAVLLKEMEDHRGQFCTILAGYKNEMKEMLSTNPGMESRIQFTLEFPDYSREELGTIAQKFLASKQYSISDDALTRFLDIMEYFRKQPNFANARTVRNVIDQVIMNQNLRTEDEENDSLIILSDVEDYLTDEGIDIRRPAPGTRKIGFV